MARTDQDPGMAANEIERLEKETVDLHTALRQALRQWKMYAETEPDRDLSTETSTEAQMYRAAVALADATQYGN